MPMRLWPSMTGSRRTLWLFIVSMASSMLSSAPMVTGLPWASSPALTLRGSPPEATHLITMSRSVIIPLSRWSSPQIGSDPTSSSCIFLAAVASVSFSPTHSAPPVMISRAVVISSTLPSLSGRPVRGTASCVVLHTHLAIGDLVGNHGLHLAGQDADVDSVQPLRGRLLHDRPQGGCLLGGGPDQELLVGRRQVGSERGRPGAFRGRLLHWRARRPDGASRRLRPSEAATGGRI